MNMHTSLISVMKVGLVSIVNASAASGVVGDQMRISFSIPEVAISDENWFGCTQFTM